MDQIKKEAPLKVAFKIVARTHNENWPAKYARGTVDFLVKALKDYFTDELDGSLFTASYHKESDAFVYIFRACEVRLPSQHRSSPVARVHDQNLSVFW